MPLSQPSVKRSCSRKRTTSLEDGNRGGSSPDAEGSVANFIHRRFQLALVSTRAAIQYTSIGVAAKRQFGVLAADPPTEMTPSSVERAHLTKFLLPRPSAAIQACTAAMGETAVRAVCALQLNRSAAMESTTETVRRVCPRWYRGGECG
jgi:hypothetical protein